MTSTTSLKNPRACSAILLVTAGCGLLAGCGAAVLAPVATSSAPVTLVAQLGGTVESGQRPIAGAYVQLYTVGTTGNASAAAPLLLSGPLITNAAGAFTLAGQYSCTNATQVYLVATAGNASLGTNSAIALMAALGPCAALSATTSIVVDERTTIAAAFALAPFLASPDHVGSTALNASGLANAFKLAQLLGSTAPAQTGTGNLTLPTAELNTLENILAACVESSGPTSSSCSTLLSATGAADTFGAAHIIATQPGNPAVTALWTLQAQSSPYAPALSAAPRDFTVAVRYAGPELASPGGIAIDSAGNAWVTNESGNSLVTLPSLSAGFVTSTYTGGGLRAPRGLSIDRAGNVWVANTGANDVVEFSSTGAVLSGTGYGRGALAAPVAIANDSRGNAWVASFYGNSIAQLGSTGAVLGGGPITTSLSMPSGIALDSAGRVAVANLASGAVCVFSSTAVLEGCQSDGTLFGATSIAVSNTGNFALAGSVGGASLTGAFTFGSGLMSSAVTGPVLGGGLQSPSAVAFDDAGTAWFTNAASLSGFVQTGAISPPQGFGALSAPSAIAVDPSGNIWTANAGDNSVTIFVGLAAPTASPLAHRAGP